MKRKKIEVEIPVPEVDWGALGESVRQLAARLHQRLLASEAEPSARLVADLRKLDRVRIADRRRLVLLTFQGAPPIRAAAQAGPDGLLRLACTCLDAAREGGTFAIAEACGHVQAASAIWHLEVGAPPEPRVDTRPWHRARIFLATREILPDFPERFTHDWAEWQRSGQPADLIGRWDRRILDQRSDEEPSGRAGPRPGTGSSGQQSRRPPPPRPAPSAPDYYAELGVPVTASTEEIRRAYRRLARKYHPDTTAEPRDRAAERFKRVTEAYEALTDPARRAEYDRRRKPL